MTYSLFELINMRDELMSRLKYVSNLVNEYGDEHPELMIDFLRLEREIEQVDYRIETERMFNV